MKRILSVILVLVLTLSMALTLASCSKSKYAGTYEMVSISGEMIYNGQTTKLDEDLYDYYRIILKSNGKAKVESKGKGSTSVYEADSTWSYSNGKINLKTVTNGYSVVEKMDWEDGVITYVASQTAQGMTINMTIILERK